MSKKPNPYKRKLIRERAKKARRIRKEKDAQLRGPGSPFGSKGLTSEGLTKLAAKAHADESEPPLVCRPPGSLDELLNHFQAVNRKATEITPAMMRAQESAPTLPPASAPSPRRRTPLITALALIGLVGGLGPKK